jgi:putative ABC transport system substrate-binding protein
MLMGGKGWAAGALIFAGPVEKAYQAGSTLALEGFRQSYGPAVEVSRESDFLRQLTTDPPQAILAVGRDAAQLAVRRAGNIPVFFILVRDPDGLGLAGRNVAGIPIDIEFLTHFAYFKRLIPRLRTLGVIYRPGRNDAELRRAQAAAQALHIALLAVPAEPRELLTAFSLIAPVIDALYWVLDETAPIEINDLQALLRETGERRLPLFTSPLGEGALVRQGALAALVPDYRQVGRVAGEHMRRIERGELNLSQVSSLPSPALPIINLRTAARINLAVPSDVQDSAVLIRN